MQSVSVNIDCSKTKVTVKQYMLTRCSFPIPACRDRKMKSDVFGRWLAAAVMTIALDYRVTHLVGENLLLT